MVHLNIKGQITPRTEACFVPPTFRSSFSSYIWAFDKTNNVSDPLIRVLKFRNLQRLKVFCSPRHAKIFFHIYRFDACHQVLNRSFSHISSPHFSFTADCFVTSAFQTKNWASVEVFNWRIMVFHSRTRDLILRMFQMFPLILIVVDNRSYIY